MRDQIQTREILLTPFELGGMGFNAGEADRVLAIISQEFDKLNGRLRDDVSVEPFADLKDEAAKILSGPLEKPRLLFGKEKEAKQKKQAEIEGKSEKPKVSETALGESENVRKEQESGIKDSKPGYRSAGQLKKESILQQGEVKDGKVMPKPVSDKPLEVQPTPRPKISTTGSGKPKIEDVKFKPKLTGPIEEIRSMTLIDFRRLGSTPKEITDKIIDKLDVLEDESFSQRIEGIKAWKESEVHNLYLELGDVGMERKMPVSEVIAQRQKNNQQTLTDEEFEAIMELNRRLRY